MSGRGDVLAGGIGSGEVRTNVLGIPIHALILCAYSCKAVFVDTDLLPASESRVGDLVQNAVEAELVRQLTETLVRCGVQESQIGIVTLYRQQVKLLQGLLHARPGIEVLTADKSQGRDKDCIVISLVRSNDGGHVRFSSSLPPCVI